MVHSFRLIHRRPVDWHGNPTSDQASLQSVIKNIDTRTLELLDPLGFFCIL